MRMSATGVLALFRMPVQREYFMQADHCCRIQYPGVLCLLVLLVWLGALAPRQGRRRLSKPRLTYYPQQTLSSIDLTSFLGITGLSAHTKLGTLSPQAATDMPHVNGGSWTTSIKPASPGTAVIALQTAGNYDTAGSRPNEELK